MHSEQESEARTLVVGKKRAPSQGWESFISAYLYRESEGQYYSTETIKKNLQREKGEENAKIYRELNEREGEGSREASPTPLGPVRDF